MDGDLLAGCFKIAAAGAVLLGVAVYFGGRQDSNRKAIMNQMEWLADHNAVYGNRNGQLDLEEKLGIMKDLNANYKASHRIRLAEAKKYISLYDHSTISITK